MGSQKPIKKEDTPDEKEARKAKEARKEAREKKPEKKKELRIKEGMDKNLRYIVRIAGKDLAGSKPIYLALTDIKGIGARLASMLAKTFEKEQGIMFDQKIGLLAEDKDKLLEDIVLNPSRHGIPGWALNRQKDVELGTDMHLLMADLDLQKRNDLQRLGKIKSYRGLRHAWGLPVRGQSTRSTHHRGGGIVGVEKKALKPAVAGETKKGE